MHRLSLKILLITGVLSATTAHANGVGDTIETWTVSCSPNCTPAQVFGSGGQATGGTGGQAGPLTQEAATRANSDYSALNGISNAGVGQVYENALSGACTTGTCTPAERAAAAARAASQLISSTASSRLAAERSAQKALEESVSHGVGSKYSQEDVNNFNKIFKEHRIPSEESLKGVHPELRDAAHALRISRGIESHLEKSMEKAAEVAKKAGALESKDSRNNQLSASLSPEGSAKRQREASSASRAPASTDGESSAPAQTYSPKFGGGSSGSSGSNVDSLLAGLPGTKLMKSVDSHGGKLDPEDKSLIAGMLHDLQADIAGSRDSSGGNAKGEAGPGAASHGAEPDAKEGGSRHATEALALLMKEGLSGGAKMAAMETALKDISIFVRVHFRIEKRAEASGMFRKP